MGTPGQPIHSVSMADESAEIFDDLYLGLRAGGALRKQRRGEPLTREEREALGRWQRLSTWRKAFAIGGFAVILAVPLAAVLSTLVDVIVRDRNPAEEEVPTVLFPAKEAER